MLFLPSFCVCKALAIILFSINLLFRCQKELDKYNTMSDLYNRLMMGNFCYEAPVSMVLLNIHGLLPSSFL